jgi:hypothetical protein
VALDIDGTLGDYHTHFQRFAESYLDHIFVEPYQGEQKYSKWFCDRFHVDVATFRQVKLAYRQGGMKRLMPHTPGAMSMVDLIKGCGAEVWLTTTRPFSRLDNIDPDTRFWLDRNHINFDGMLYDEEKYKRLAEQVDPDRVVAVLDDTAEQLAEARRVFGWDVPIMKNNEANKRVDHMITNCVNTLDEAAVMITERVTNWRGAHA